MNKTLKILLASWIVLVVLPFFGGRLKFNPVLSGQTFTAVLGDPIDKNGQPCVMASWPPPGVPVGTTARTRGNIKWDQPDVSEKIKVSEEIKERVKLDGAIYVPFKATVSKKGEVTCVQVGDPNPLIADIELKKDLIDTSLKMLFRSEMPKHEYKSGKNWILVEAVYKSVVTFKK